MNPISTPKGAAAEYGELALNIYTGCNHGCSYCYAPAVLRKTREAFAVVEARTDIVAAVKRQLKSQQITGQTIHLCFSCDPYPAPPVDTMPTREIIMAIKDAGNHVQILTKGGMRAERDFDLLDSGDWFGVTYAGYPDGITSIPEAEPNSSPIIDRIASLLMAHKRGIKTWVSIEPVLFMVDALRLLKQQLRYIDRYMIGKLNHVKSDKDWAEFGRIAESICIAKRYDYTIKQALRDEMRKEARQC